MTRASISRLTTDGTTGAAALELISGGKGFFLRELVLTLVAATASVYGCGRPAAAGITPTGPVRFLKEGSPVEFVSASSAVAWGTGPTVPAQFMRRNSLPATIGSDLKWTFQELYVPAGSTFVLWNGAANSVAHVNLVVDVE